MTGEKLFGEDGPTLFVPRDAALSGVSNLQAEVSELRKQVSELRRDLKRLRTDDSSA